MPKIQTKVKITTKDRGAKKLIEDLGGTGGIRIGVQGDDVNKPHPGADGLSIGDVAAIHEFGLGVPRRRWLGDWIDKHEKAMVDQINQGMQQVLARQTSRKKVLTDLGYKWTDEIRKNLADGKVRPALSPATVRRKGHNIPLLDTGALVNHITYSVSMTQIKSVKDPAMREALRLGTIQTPKTSINGK